MEKWRQARIKSEYNFNIGLYQHFHVFMGTIQAAFVRKVLLKGLHPTYGVDNIIYSFVVKTTYLSYKN